MLIHVLTLLAVQAAEQAAKTINLFGVEVDRDLFTGVQGIAFAALLRSVVIPLVKRSTLLWGAHGVVVRLFLIAACSALLAVLDNAAMGKTVEESLALGVISFAGAIGLRESGRKITTMRQKRKAARDPDHTPVRK